MAQGKGKNRDRLDQCEKDIFELKKEMDRSKEAFDRHIEEHVKEDLQEKRFQGSNKFMYTYEDIAQKNNISKAKVQKIAEENGLTRRNLKIIK